MTHDFFLRKPLIGMVHLGSLPGSPRDTGRFREVLDRAVADARALNGGGVDALMVENFFDAPFHKSQVPPCTIAAITAAVLAVREAVALPVGLNVLRNDACAAFSIAHVTGAEFIRCNVYVGAAVTDQGIIEGAAREVVALRKMLGADVRIWADVGVKHAAQLGDTPIDQQARDATERGMADALIVTGSGTGVATPLDRIRQVRDAVPGAPLLVGSGVDEETVADILRIADGVIVGSSLKEGGVVSAPVDRERVKRLVAAARG